MATKPDIELLDTEEMLDELIKRHDALIICGLRPNGSYYCNRNGSPFNLRALLSMTLDLTRQSIRKWETTQADDSE